MFVIPPHCEGLISTAPMCGQITRSSTSSKSTSKAASLTRSRRSSTRTLRVLCPSANYKSRFTRARVTSVSTNSRGGGRLWKRPVCGLSGRSRTWCTSTWCAVHDPSWQRHVSSWYYSGGRVDVLTGCWMIRYTSIRLSTFEATTRSSVMLSIRATLRYLHNRIWCPYPFSSCRDSSSAGLDHTIDL